MFPIKLSRKRRVIDNGKCWVLQRQYRVPSTGQIRWRSVARYRRRALLISKIALLPGVSFRTVERLSRVLPVKHP
jgi:hypothetical protein